MLKKLKNLCIIGTIALIGADRIDLFAGHGPFIFIPFLLFSFLFVIAAILPWLMNGSTTFRRPSSVQRQTPFLIWTCLFLALTFLSIPLGLDPMRGFVHFADIFLLAAFAYALSVGLLTNPENERLIVLAVALGLVIYALFCVGELIAWSHGFHLDEAESYSYIQTMFAPAVFGIFPRLCGSTVDPNRSGFVLTMYLMLLDRFAPQSRWKRLLGNVIAFFVFLTLSKSAILSYLIYRLCSKAFWSRMLSLRTLGWIAAAVVACSLTLFVYRAQIDDALADLETSNAILDRLSFGEGTSGESHVLLIQRGLEAWESTPKTVFMGIGFGAAPHVVGDILGTDEKQANFHSLYVSVLAELGLPAFVAIMILLLYPFFTRVQTAPALFSIMAFNIAYQSHLEPVFWLALALLWSSQLRNGDWLKAHSHPSTHVERVKSGGTRAIPSME